MLRVSHAPLPCAACSCNSFDGVSLPGEVYFQPAGFGCDACVTHKTSAACVEFSTHQAGKCTSPGKPALLRGNYTSECQISHSKQRTPNVRYVVSIIALNCIAANPTTQKGKRSTIQGKHSLAEDKSPGTLGHSGHLGR